MLCGAADLKEYVNDENVEHILERDDDAVEDSLELGNAVDCLERSKHAKELQGLEFLTSWGPTKGVKVHPIKFKFHFHTVWSLFTHARVW